MTPICTAPMHSKKDGRPNTEDGSLKTENIMGSMIESFRDLNVYKLAIELQQEIFKLTKKFPKEETYSLIDQIRRASRSIGSNIAEAWHKRRYPAHFLSKLSDSDAEQAETQHWLDTSLQCKYVSGAEHRRLLEKCQRIGRMLGKMMKNPDSFCKAYNEH